MDDFSIFFNNGVAVAVAWYVLTRLNSTLKDLTGVINNLNKDINKRLDALESKGQVTQMQLHELKIQVANLKRGDS